jgi:glutaredoxin
MSDIILTALTSPGCRHCERLLEFWKTESADWPDVVLHEVSILTPEGQSLAREHSILAAPGVLIGDELVSVGGFDPDELREWLKVARG